MVFFKRNNLECAFSMTLDCGSALNTIGRRVTCIWILCPTQDSFTYIKRISSWMVKEMRIPKNPSSIDKEVTFWDDGGNQSIQKSTDLTRKWHFGMLEETRVLVPRNPLTRNKQAYNFSHTSTCQKGFELRQWGSVIHNQHLRPLCHLFCI